jgi:hypothetical protein
MPLDTVEAWTSKQNGTEKLELIRRGDLPLTYDRAHGTEWDELVYDFATETLAGENLDFLAAVDKYRADPAPSKAREIYAEYVAPQSAPNLVNLSSSVTQALASLSGDVSEEELNRYVIDGASGLFDAACNDVIQGMASVYGPFTTAVATVKRHLLPAGVTQDDIDGWNKAALKALAEGESVSFCQVVDLYQVGSVVVIDSSESGAAATIEWARSLAGQAGRITMVEKGGVFGHGSIRAEGVQDQSAFEAAIARFSQKAVQY